MQVSAWLQQLGVKSGAQLSSELGVISPSELARVTKETASSTYCIDDSSIDVFNAHCLRNALACNYYITGFSIDLAGLQQHSTHAAFEKSKVSLSGFKKQTIFFLTKRSFLQSYRILEP